MKLNFVCAFMAAFACSASLISSAHAGGHHQGFGLSNSAATSASTGAALPNGRSPLGEPVFLIPSPTTGSVSAPSAGPIGGYVPPRTPLPPLRAPDPNIAALVTPTGSNSSGSVTSQHISPVRERVHLPERPAITGGPDRGTKVIFTPPPTTVRVRPSTTGTGNIAGINKADRTFGPSILNTGLGSNIPQPAP